MTWLLLILPVVVIAGLLWSYQRKMGAREAASAERLKAFLDKPPMDEAAADAARPAEFSVPNIPAPKEYAAREGLLTAPQRVLFYLLKTQLADHEVLAKVSAAGVIDIPARFSGFERETRERRLALATVDFVVCDKAFKPMVVVQCRDAEDRDAAHLAFARECCAAAGLNWVEISVSALPARDTVRAVVLGV